MNKFWFYTPKILATVVFITLLSFIGVGNPKVVPLFALFFIAVFVGFYFFNKSSRERDRSEKSNPVMMRVMQIIGLAVFLLVFSLLGFLQPGKTGQAISLAQIIGFICWFALFAGISFVIFILIRKHQRHFDLVTSKPTSKIILSIILLLLAIAIPVIVVSGQAGSAWQSLNKPGAAVPGSYMFPVVLKTLAATLILVIVMLASVVLISVMGKSTLFKIFGYVAMFLTALLPGLFTIMYFQDAARIAEAYMLSLMVIIIAYSAWNLAKERLPLQKLNKE